MWAGDRGEEGPPPLVFRLHHGAPEVVREVLLERGWEEYNEQEQKAGDWNLYWRASTFSNSDYENLLPWQRLNHHPKTGSITRKDYLARHLRRMRGAHGSALYDFSPTVFILPNDYTRFLAEYTKHRLVKGGGGSSSSAYWICKPVGLSRGRGIFIFEDIKDLVYDSPVIVQRYISSPLLISGYKFDLRIYVCVKSFVPLTIYIHQEGLVRFATEKYDLSSLDNLFAHLTNTSINKLGPFYASDKESVGQGCKWTMSKFRCFLHSQGINAFPLWQKINNIVTLTLLTIAPSIPSSPNCIELFGFDILVDSKFKPWLLEVNYSPALTLDCQVDVAVKKGLIGDLIDLMNYRSNDCLRVSGHQRHKRPCCLGSLPSEPPVLPKYSRSQIRNRQSCSQSSQTLAKAPCEPTQSSHTQKRPLPEVICQHQSHKRSHSQLSLYNLLAARQRYLPSFDLKRIHAERRWVINTDVGSRTAKTRAARGVNPIHDPHSRSPINKPVRPALASWPTVNGALLLSEVTGCCDDDNRAKMDTPELPEVSNVSSVTSDSPRPPHGHLRQRHPPVHGTLVTAGQRHPPVDGTLVTAGQRHPPVHGTLVTAGQRHPPVHGTLVTAGQRHPPVHGTLVTEGPCKLPDIHRRKPLRAPWGSTRAQARDGAPPLRVGDFILTFPFNKATLKASRDKLDVKMAIQEVHRLTGQLATGGRTRSERKQRLLKEAVREERGVGEDDFDSLFWGPKDPPLLRDCYLSS